MIIVYFSPTLQELLCYANQPVFVRRLANNEKGAHSAAAAGPNEDADFVNGAAGGSARKSNRRLKRGEKKIIVSSDLVLQKFKIKVSLLLQPGCCVSHCSFVFFGPTQLMNLFQVPPFDQNLHLGTRTLSDSTKTLGELEVLPNSLILLSVDEPGGGHVSGNGVGGGVGTNAVDEEEWNEEIHMEEGFKGRTIEHALNISLFGGGCTYIGLGKQA